MTSPVEIEVRTGSQSYSIVIGPGLLSRPELLQPHLAGDQVMIVSNTTVAPLYLETLAESLSGRRIHTCILPDGERYKDFDRYRQILDALADAGCHRNVTLIALGGGVVGDLTGFAAATWQRGVPYIQIPTTSLAQVDSSVGGKTAINHPRGKNLVGAFHQPRLVLTDTQTLETLPARHFRAGLAEVIKAAIIADHRFFEWLDEHCESILAGSPALITELIARACTIKADIVRQDERETGIRAWLNLGHSFAHGLELVSGYGELLHGEAVSVGLCLAAKMSVHRGLLDEEAAARIHRLLDRFGLPTRMPAEVDRTALVEAMALDKKNLQGQYRLVLPEALGRVDIHRLERELLQGFIDRV